MCAGMITPCLLVLDAEEFTAAAVVLARVFVHCCKTAGPVLVSLLYG